MDDFPLFDRALFASKRDDADEITRLLRMRKELISEQYPDGSTLLHFSAANGSLKVIDALLAWGADINALNGQGRTPLCVAAVEMEHQAITFLLQKGATLNTATPDGHNVLPYAVTDTAILQSFIEAGLELSRHSPDALSYAHWHYMMGSKATALFFIDKCGMDVNEQDQKSKDTVLHTAVREKDPVFARELLNRGANIDAENKNGWTPLTLSVTHSETFKVLFESDPNPDKPGNYGYLIHRAVGAGNADIVHFLLGKDARIDVRNEQGMTPIEFAREIKQGEIEAILTKEQQKRFFEENIKRFDGMIRRPNRPKI